MVVTFDARSVRIEAMKESSLILHISTPRDALRSARSGQRGAGKRQRGFSMVELMMVLAIALVILAIALPRMATSYTYAKWRGEVGDLSGIFQSCRSQAIKNNQTEQLTFAKSAGTNGLTVAYIFDWDVSSSSPLTLGQDTESMLAAQKQVWTFSHFSNVEAPTGANPPPLTKATMWGGTDTGSPTSPWPSPNICFNSRGIPCDCPKVTPNHCNAILDGYAFYFQQDAQWAAVGVSPAGRIKTYYWDGKAWAN